jgi:hypothetical protein
MKINTITILLFGILFLAIYQDFPLVAVFGEIARSPIIFVIPLMLIYLMSLKKIMVSNYTEYFIYYVLYLMFISLVFIPILYFLNGSLIFLKENLILKTIKMSVYPLSALVFYQFVYTILSRGKDTLKSLFKAIFCLQVFVAIYLLFEVFFLKRTTIFMSFLHVDPSKYYRVRLLTVEESWAGTVLTFFVFVPVFLVNYLEYSKQTKQKVYSISAFIFLYYTLVSESKGYLLLVLVSILPMTIGYMFKSKKLRKIVLVLIPVVFVVTVFVFIVLKTTIESQIHTSITFGTRFTSYLSAIKIFLTHPFGVGWSGFVYYLPETIRETINGSWVSTLDLDEIKGYLLSTKGLSTKTEFFDGLIYGGIGFLVFYYQFFVKRVFFFFKVKNPTFFFLKVPLIFSILAGSIYITFHIKYEVWFLMAFLDVMQNRISNEAPIAE